MDLKPLPVELPAKEDKKPAKPKNQKKNKNSKLTRRVQKIQTTVVNGFEHPEDKVLKETCVKILGYLEKKKSKSVEHAQELHLALQRAVLAVQSKRRSDIHKSKKRKGR